MALSGGNFKLLFLIVRFYTAWTRKRHLGQISNWQHNHGKNALGSRELTGITDQWRNSGLRHLKKEPLFPHWAR
jgi:hypothetical protein